MSAKDYPLLAASHNATTRFFISLYRWDRFITVGVVADICAVVWLATSTFDRLKPNPRLAAS